jgi:peptidoglycan/LPS O-acetylase OafA/YrhL
VSETGLRSEQAQAPSRHDLPALDGLRGLAALLVLVTHTAFLTGTYAHGWLGTVSARFDVGVSIFFVLSGFLLTRPWVRTAGTPGLPNVRRYARHRAARILPAYWLALALVVVTVNRTASPSAVASNLALLQTYTDDLLVAFTQTWSLVAEAAFYVALPALAPWVCRRLGSSRPYLRLTLLGLVGLAWTAAAALGLFERPWASTWMPAHLLWFAVGMTLAVVELDTVTRLAGFLRELASSPGTLIGLAVVSFSLTCTALAGPTGLETPHAWQAVVKEVLYAVVAGSLVLGCGLGVQRSGIPGTFAGRTGRFAGRVSYGVFLWHQLVLVGVLTLLGLPEFSGNMLVVTVLTLAGSVAVAWASWSVLEQPVLSRVSRREGRAVAVSS